MGGKLGSSLLDEVMKGMDETGQPKKKVKTPVKSEPKLGSPIIPDNENIGKKIEDAFNKMTDQEKYKFTYGNDEEKTALKQKYGIN